MFACLAEIGGFRLPSYWHGNRRSFRQRGVLLVCLLGHVKAIGEGEKENEEAVGLELGGRGDLQ